MLRKQLEELMAEATARAGTEAALREEIKGLQDRYSKRIPRSLCIACSSCGWSSTTTFYSQYCSVKIDSSRSALKAATIESTVGKDVLSGIGMH